MLSLTAGLAELARSLQNLGAAVEHT